jgi:hypothetical protein
MASSDAVLDHVQATLMAGPADPFFQRALDYVTDHGYGKATQPVEVGGPDGQPFVQYVGQLPPPSDDVTAWAKQAKRTLGS